MERPLSRDEDSGTRERPSPCPILSQEIEDGSSIEFKITLCTVTPSRLSSLATQMRWRLREGSGKAVYYLGVRDDGLAVGLSAADADTSLNVLGRVAAIANAKMVGVEWMHSAADASWSVAGARADAARRRSRQTTDLVEATDGCLRVIRVTIHQAVAGPALGLPAGGSPGTARASALCEEAPAGCYPPNALPVIKPARIALVGATGCGKSTLIAAVAMSLLDNGRGSARSTVMRHRHEIEQGVSSTVGSWWSVGFDESGAIVSSSGADDVSVASAGDDGHDILSFRVSSGAACGAGEGARATRAACLFDLPGAPKYERYLLEGLFCSTPDAIILVVNGADALLGGPATRAHANLCSSMGISPTIVVTRAESLAMPREQISSSLASCGRSVSPPIFVSCVTGEGLDEVARALSRATPSALLSAPLNPLNPLLSSAEGIFRVLGSWVVKGDIVVGCICIAGVVREGMTAVFGPLDDGALRRSTIECIHVAGERAADGAVHAGQLGSLSLGPAEGIGGRKWLRRGSLVVASAEGAFEAISPTISSALLPSRSIAFFPLTSDKPPKIGASTQLIGASGLRVFVTVVEINSSNILLELSPPDYVEDGIAALSASESWLIGRTSRREAE